MTNRFAIFGEGDEATDLGTCDSLVRNHGAEKLHDLVVNNSIHIVDNEGAVFSSLSLALPSQAMVKLKNLGTEAGTDPMGTNVVFFTQLAEVEELLKVDHRAAVTTKLVIQEAGSVAVQPSLSTPL